MGLAEVLPGRVQNLPRPRSSSELQPPGWPHLGSADDPKQLMLQQMPASPRGWPNQGPADGFLLPEQRGQPHQLGLAEVLPGRVRNLPGLRSSSKLQPPGWPHPGSADDPKQLMLQQMPASVAA